MFVANKDITLYLFRKELIEKIVSDKHEVTILCPSGSKIQHFIDLGCKFINLSIDRRGKNPFKELITLSKIFKNIKKIKPEIVFTYTVKPNLYVGIVRRFIKFKFFPTVTGLGTTINNKGFISSIIKMLYMLSFKKAHNVFFQNEENYKWFLKNVSPKTKGILVAGSGVNVNFFKYNELNDSSVTRFLFLGRIMKDKGIEELIEASKYLKEKYNNEVQIRVAGFFEENYKDIFDNLKYVIDYVGYIEDSRDEINKCSALVLPSYHEGLSNVLLEAQASGRPVIASNIPGCIETFIDGISGLLIEPKNIKSLIEAMERFHLLSNDTKKTMGFEGRKYIEKKFNRNGIINTYFNAMEGE